MNTEIPHLKIERLANGCIRLENESMGDSYMVDVHPLHLRYMAEKLGLVHEMSATEAEALQTVARLTRRLGVLHDRIAKMDAWLWEHRDFDEADINVEIWFSKATLELSTEFQAEMADAATATTSGPRVTSDEPTPNPMPPKNGAVQAPQKRGCSPQAKSSTSSQVAAPAQLDLAG